MSTNNNYEYSDSSSVSGELLLSVYSDIFRLREFERQLIDVVKNRSNEISRVHLSSGQETVGIALAHVFPNECFFITHRCTELFIALNIPLELIRDEILCLDTGCSKGKAGSLFSFINNQIRIQSHTGFIGEQIPIAVGYAFGCRQKTICITGDGGAEEDYALQAYGFAATHRLPILFVCNDNELSIESEKKTRRSWKLTDVARAFGMNVVEANDDPIGLINIFTNIKDKLPALINVRVNREYCHSGIEKTRFSTNNWLSIIKRRLKCLGYEDEIKQIEKKANIEMFSLWRDYL